MPDGKKIQRDLYSAFLLQHANMDFKSYDVEGLNHDYDSFVKLHDGVIEELRCAPKTLASMGIVRTARNH